jgi:hypothetical protein
MPILNNTSQLQPPLNPALVSEASQDSVRMSSFIDFGSNDSEDNLKALPAESTNSPKHRLGKEAMDKVRLGNASQG